MTTNTDITIDPVALEAARLAVEDVLIEWRDNGMFVMNRNGFAIHNYDGSPSPIIRLSTAMGLSIGIEAYLKALKS